MRLHVWLAATALAAALPAQTPSITPGGILNGASFATGQGVAAGSLVSIFGSELAAGLGQNDTVPLSTTLGNVSVTVNDIPAGLYFVSPGQINAQIPWDVLPAGAAAGAVSVVVKRNGVLSQPQTVSILAVAPGVFYLPTLGSWAIAINLDGTLAAPEGAIPGLATHPAAADDVIVLYATGLGAVDTPVANGADSLDKLRNTLVKPTVLVGGRQAPLLFSGLTPQFPGVNQVNFTVPRGMAPGVVPVQLQAGGITTSNQALMAVR